MVTRHSPLPVRQAMLDIGEYLTAWRKFQRLTVADLSKRSGVSASTIARIEDGHGASLENVLLVATTLGVRDALVAAIDPFESERGRALMAAELPRRVG